MLTTLGFPPAHQVQGRSSIADLFMPELRCGIYVLHFANGEFYAGQAIDVTRRYIQHRTTYPDIEKISFKHVPQAALNDSPLLVIWRLEEAGWPLRNIVFTSLPKGASDFDLIMPEQAQQRWLSDTAFIDDAGQRIIDPDLRRRYHHNYTRFMATPYARPIIDVLRAYVALGIPAFRRSEVAFWACSCMPERRIYARISLNWQEVLTAYADERGLCFTVHLARTPLARRWTQRVLLRLKYPGVEHQRHRYVPGGSDQTSVRIPAHSAARFLAEPAVTQAVRLFNLRLMKKGPCTFGRYHCLDLADHLIP